jgi:predicted phosphodiesterase
MAQNKQFRDSDLSLWQSAVNEVVSTKTSAGAAQSVDGPAVVPPPDPNNPMLQQSTADLTPLDEKQAELPIPTDNQRAATEGVGQTLAYCSTVARKLAFAKLTGNTADEQKYKALLGDFTECDPRWAETVEVYVKYKLAGKNIPYRRHTQLSDFVIDGKLPAQARVALVGDWGTGQEDAKQVLAQIARKKPNVVIHMGDIYYSATDFEVQNYFYNIWNGLLPGIPSYTLAGNHDMFAGGGPFYRLLDQLGQPASYFCIRNDNWQFVAMDTGLHDCAPDPAMTYLESTELSWHTDKIVNSGGRQTVLLSHHQLFTAFEDLPNKTGLNGTLLQQVGPLLPKVTCWFWGHEHNLVIYKPYLGVTARCIGHGAFPVAQPDIPATPPHPEAPLEDVRLDMDSEGLFYNHGYVIMDLNGAAATVSYYQDSDEDNPQWTEKFPAAAKAAG